MGRSRKQRDLPKRFTPKFWQDVDGRLGLKKRVRKRYLQLKEESQSESIQRDLLCQRAAFISIVLETMECSATESGDYDGGAYVQGCNALQGILTKLGLEK